MRLLITIIILTLLWMPLFLQAQTSTFSQTLKGRVIDQQAKSPIIGANIVVEGSVPLKGGSTDTEGYFKIVNVPLGRLTIKCSSMGYQEIIMPNVVITSGKETSIDIELQEKVLDEVIVRSGVQRNALDKELVLISGRGFDIEETRRFAGSRNDPSRMAANYAGVTGNNDSRNDIIIRGNSPAGLLWKLEGVDIPNPNHFGALGATGGPVGMLNNNQLAKSTFVTGAFPSVYGNGISGVFDLNIRNGNEENREFTGQVGFSGFEFGAEGPFSKKSRASYMVNYRYSFLGLLKDLGVNFGTGSGIPKYQDLSFKVFVPIPKMGTFTIFGLGGLSSIAFANESASNFYSSGQNLDYQTNMGVVGISNQYFFNKNTSGKLTIAYTDASVRTINDAIENNKAVPDYRDYSSQSRLSLQYVFNQKINAQHQLTAGLTYNSLGMNYLDSTRYTENGISKFRTLRNYNDNSALWQGYANWQYRPSNRLTLNAGLYSQVFLLNNSTAIEPRIGLRYAVGGSQTLSLGIGKHSQLQPLMSYFMTKLADGKPIEANRNLGFSQADHFVLGYEKSLGQKSRLKIETYYQNLYNIPVDTKSSEYSMINFGADFSNPQRVDLVNNGTGYNYGIELTAERTFSQNFYYLATISVFDSRYKGSNGTLYNTAFNGNYTANLLAGKEWKMGVKGTIALDIKVTSAGGRRYTPIDLEASKKANEVVYQRDKNFASQSDAYFRTDIKITYRRNGPKVMQEWFLDFQNVSNKANFFAQGFDRASGKITTSYQLGFFPLMNYRIQF
jgi:hypothetical protein